MNFTTVVLCPWKRSFRYPLIEENWVGLGAENLTIRQPCSS